MKILIVDDDPDTRHILKLIIEMQGHEVIEASDGLQGLEKTKANMPDLIISDILMPGMDGFQFLREANSDKNLGAIPFVFYSSTYTGEEEIGLAFSSGADGFIVKPKSPEKFWEELNNILSKREEEKSKKTKPIKDEEYLKRYSHMVSVKLEEKVKELEKTLEERKKAEDNIKQIVSQQQAILNNIPDMAWLKDKESKFIAVNEPFGNACGIRPGDLVGKTDLDIWPKELAERYRADDREVMKSEKRKQVEEPLIDKDGKEIWIETIKTPIYDYTGSIIGTTGIARNITERRQTEKYIFDLSLRHDAILAAVPDIIMEVDNQKVYTWANKAGYEFFGEDVIGKEAAFYFEGQQDTYTLVEPLFKGTENIFYVESLQRRKDGEKRLLAWWCRVLKDKSGNVKGALSSARDITERKKMEEEVYRIKQDWEDTFNSITDMVTVHDKDWNIIRANKAAEKILDLLFLEKTTDTKCFKYYHGTEKPPEGCPSCGCLKNGKPALFEIFEPHLNMFIEIRAIPRFDSDNNLIGLIHVVRDITERKKAEEALKTSREYAKNIIDSSLDMIISVDTTRRIVEFNKAAQETFGYRLEEVLGKPVDILYADAAEGLKVHKTTVEHGRHVQEILNLRKTGEVFPSLLSASVLCGTEGKIIGVMGVSRDITDRKKEEERLNKFLSEIAKAKLEWEITFDNVTELIALVDKDFRIVRCNKVLAEFSDKPINEIPGNKFTDIFPMGEQDAGYLAERIQKEESSEWMEVTAAERWFYLSHQPVMNPDSLFLYSVIIATDITALKHSEQELMGSEEELKKRVKELEKFYEMAVDRELKMKELKKELKSLNEELSRYKTGS
ncbi:MAG: PAS domain S-box protein [Nitrospirae bacterium]|nr:PAS domain S-box protein [Nitrospirota bacterium]